MENTEENSEKMENTEDNSGKIGYRLLPAIQSISFIYE
jgi:hypothetical protein